MVSLCLGILDHSTIRLSRLHQNLDLNTSPKGNWPAADRIRMKQPYVHKTDPWLAEDRDTPRDTTDLFDETAAGWGNPKIERIWGPDIDPAKRAPLVPCSSIAKTTNVAARSLMFGTNLYGLGEVPLLQKHTGAEIVGVAPARSLRVAQVIAGRARDGYSASICVPTTPVAPMPGSPAAKIAGGGVSSLSYKWS